MLGKQRSGLPSRRYFIKSSLFGLGGAMIGLSRHSKITGRYLFGAGKWDNKDLIKSYCIDFNWGNGGPNAFAPPGLWADADPVKHIQWYSELGCDVVQTFAVSSNGYAWYKDGFIPEQPGLKHDFLPQMVKIGHEKGMMVFGYFCVGANTKWGQDHPDLSYGIPASPHSPLTTRYLDYLCSSIEDAVYKTAMDGFMVDWLWNPVTPDKPLRWLKCEREMFEELMHMPFPGADKIQPEVDMEFRRKAIDRCWTRIRDSAKKAKSDCIIWLSCNNLFRADIQGSLIFKQVDWLMNEAGVLTGIDAVRKMVGKNTRLLTCLANWNGQDPIKIVPQAMTTHVGLYGFTKPRQNSLPPSMDSYFSRPASEFQGDDRNIAVLARAYNGLPFDYVKHHS
jgi:hypothetical protein